MIDVRVNYDRMTVIATGHAGSPRTEDDRDLACCGFSMLLQAMIYSCQELPGVLVRPNLAKGDAFVQISTSPSQEQPVQHRLRMFADGVKMLSEKWPGCFKLK